MESTSKKRSTCRLCGQKNIILALQLAPTPIGDAYSPNALKPPLFPLDLYLCQDCGLAQLLDVVAPKALYDNFTYTTSISLGLTNHFQKYADSVLQFTSPPAGSLVIDIGSNDGTLLKAFKQNDMRVLGIEPADEIAQKATRQGINTLTAYFSSEFAQRIKAEYGAAFIVTSNNTFANIDDLEDIVLGIKKLLAPEGFFILETGYLLDLVNHKLFDNIYHEHLSYFSVKPLINFFSRHDMKIVNIERIETKGGSIRLMIQTNKGERLISENVAAMAKVETEAGLYSLSAFDTFSASIKNTKKSLKNFISGLKTQGKTIAGFGASVGTTTLIATLGLGDLLDFLIDDNPQKHNTFSPGDNIPVRPASELYTANPEYTIILAWRYAEPIIKKNQAYLERGGAFIIPWPEIQTINNKSATC